MTNYYERLNISKDISLEEINRILSEQENLWIKREINSPEKSRVMLTLIDEARIVFKDIKSRMDYDTKLEKSKEESTINPIENDSEEYDHLIEEAQKFLSIGIFDIAKDMIDRAILVSTNKNDCIQYELAAKIYCKNGLFKQALDYANQLIIVRPEQLLGYETKLNVLNENYQSSTYKEPQDKENLLNQIKGLRISIIKLAKQQKDYDRVVQISFDLCSDLLQQYRKDNDYSKMILAKQYIDDAISVAVENGINTNGLYAILPEIKNEIIDESQLENEEIRARQSNDLDKLYRIYQIMTSTHPRYYLPKLFIAGRDIKNKYDYAHVPEALSEYKIHLEKALEMAQSTAVNNDELQINNYIQIYEELYDFFDNTVNSWRSHYYNTEGRQRVIRYAIITSEGVSELFSVWCNFVSDALGDLNAYPQIKTIVIKEWKGLIENSCSFLEGDNEWNTYMKQTEGEKFRQRALDLYEKVKKYEPDYIRVIPKVSTSAVSKSGGCYVATCVYGSYDCPEVWTLRRFRDYSLAKTWYGRAFIKTYYAISPKLVKCFGDTNWFKAMWRGKLDFIVNNLKARGYQDTKYEEK